MKIVVNGVELPIDAAPLARMTDLVEVIRSQIDPDHMITSLTLNGEPLKDEEWQSPPRQFGTKVLEVETGLPQTYVRLRLEEAPEVAQSLFVHFRDTRKTFAVGDFRGGNRKLAVAVRLLHDFLNWYHTIIQLVDEGERERLSIDPLVREIGAISESMSQHQLHQSWWAIGEVIECKLEPVLERIEDFLRKVAWEAARAA